MKIKLNEKDKETIKCITEGAVLCTDAVITGAGCGTIGAIALRNKKCGLALALALALAGATSIYRIKSEYWIGLLCDTDNACDWIFNKLENSNQKVVEFEKQD